MRPPVLTFGPFAFDSASRILSRAGQELPLPPRVLGVLEVLLNRAGDVVPRQELIEKVWKDAFVTDTSLAEAVSALRQVLEDDAQSPTYVQTLHRRGYRFVAPVSRTTAEPVATSPSIGGQLVPWSVAAICAMLAAAAVWQAVGTRAGVEPGVARFSIPLAAGERLNARAAAIAVSPDGTAVVWSACDDAGCGLRRRQLDRLAAEEISGTAGGSSPFFSPDGRSVGFFADGRLKTVPLAGGVATALAEAPDPRGAVWTERREIVYGGSAMSGLSRVAESGGEPEVLTIPRASDGEIAHVWPALTPSGDTILFTVLTSPGATRGRLAALRTDGAAGATDWRPLLSGVGGAIAATPHALLFSRGDELQTVWFDRQRLSVEGAAPVVVLQAARAAAGAHYAISASGALLHGEPSSPPAASFVWIHPSRAPVAAADPDRPLVAPALSGDGRRLAGADEADGTRGDIWIADLSRGTTVRVTHGGQNAAPVWHQSAIFYASRDGGAHAIWRKDADSASAPTRIHGSAAHALPVAVSPDGSGLAFLGRGETTRTDLWLLPLGGGSPAPLVQTPFDEGAAAFSPDGRLLAYQSSEGGRWDVYVQRLSDGRRLVISRAGGTAPVWVPDGSALLYQSGGDVMRASIGSAASLSIGAPERLAAVGDAELVGIDRSGRLLVRRLPPQPTSIRVVLNWTRELRALLGPPPAWVPR